eukprot:sb/3466929/
MMNLLLLATACVYFSPSTSSVSPPSIVTTPPSTTSIPWKTALVLQCKTQSWPGSPTYFWKKNGNTIYPNSDEKLLFSDTKQSLTLSNATKSQSGEYVCIATENDAYLFETSVALTVVVIEPPSIPAAPSASNISSTSLTLSWSGDAAQYYIVNLNPGDIEVKSTLPSIALTQLQPYTLYTLSVAAFNSAGTRGSSETTSIRTVFACQVYDILLSYYILREIFCGIKKGVWSHYNKGIFQLDREIMCNKSFPTPLYSEWTPLTIPTNAQIEQRVLMPHFQVGVVLASREKIEGTRVISVLALVGVGAGIKSLSHLVN